MSLPQVYQGPPQVYPGPPQVYQGPPQVYPGQTPLMSAPTQNSIIDANDLQQLTNLPQSQLNDNQKSELFNRVKTSLLTQLDNNAYYSLSSLNQFIKLIINICKVPEVKARINASMDVWFPIFSKLLEKIETILRNTSDISSNNPSDLSTLAHYIDSLINVILTMDRHTQYETQIIQNLLRTIMGIIDRIVVISGQTRVAPITGGRKTKRRTQRRHKRKI